MADIHGYLHNDTQVETVTDFGACDHDYPVMRFENIVSLSQVTIINSGTITYVGDSSDVTGKNLDAERYKKTYPFRRSRITLG